MWFSAELEEFFQYVIALEFHEVPDYERCKDMFKKGLKKRKFPLDGKIDFAAAKKASPTKKVRTPMKTRKVSTSPLALKKSALVKTKVKIVAKAKKVANKKAVITMLDAGCQTSPAFVKAAKAAVQAKKRGRATAGINPELDEFCDKAVASAQKVNSATKRISPRKRQIAATSSSATNGTPDSFDNPTPAMQALLDKRAERQAQQAKTKRARK